MTGRPYALRFEGDRYVGPGGTATFRLDTGREPKVLERTYLDGRSKGSRWDAIYRLDGDQLWLCDARPGQPLPARFAAPRGSGIWVRVYERVRPAGE